MPQRKKTTGEKAKKKNVKKVTKKPVKRKTKVTIKKKPAVKAKKVVSKQPPVAGITFDFGQKELVEIVKKQRELEAKTLSNELAAILPDDDCVFKQRTVSQLTINNISEQSNRSPFVLDLSELAGKKQQQEQSKKQIHSFFINKKNLKAEKKKLLSQIEPQEILPPKETVLSRAQQEEPAPIIQVCIPKKEKQFTQQPWFYNFNLPLNWHRPLAVYLVICLMIVIPIKVFGNYSNIKETEKQATTYAQLAYEDLKIASQAISNQEFETASQSFADANQNFEQASQTVDEIDLSLKSILKLVPRDGANLADAEALLAAGEQLTEVAQKMTAVLDFFNQNNGLSLTDRISLLQENLKITLPKLKKVQTLLESIREKAIPAEYQETFTKIKKYFNLILLDLEELDRLSFTINEILGKDYERRYLFIFQNNNEIRPTGGFMGSLALVDIDRGAIENIEIPGGGTYDLQGSLLENKIAPYPLQLVNARWEMQDANWFPDFPTSAQKIKWFYEESGGPTVDGVIALNASLIPKLLETTGSIYLPDYNKTLSAANFVEETQNTIQENKTSDKPKQILSDLAPPLLEKIFNSEGEDLLKIAQALKQGLDEKEIQMYFINPEVQTEIESHDWAGQLKETSKDYLAVINSNIGGYKTDAFINQTIDLVSEIQANGEIINTLTLTREHTGNSNDLFSQHSNVAFVRIYTPQGSQLLSAEGFSQIPASAFEPVDETWEEDELLEKTQGNIWVDPQSQTQVNNEFNKTVFGNWIQVDPGETTTITLRYKLPLKLTFTTQDKFSLFKKKAGTPFHSLYLQKQSGQQNTTFNVSVVVPKNHSLKWNYPKQASTHHQEITFTDNLSEDQLLAFTIE